METEALPKQTNRLAGVTLQGVTTSQEAGAAGAAHARINIPLNLDNWRELDAETRDELVWFHQHCLDNGLNWDAAEEAVGYDKSTLFKVLKGVYERSYKDFCDAVRKYRRLQDQRGSIQKNEFVETPVTKLISSGLSYALANNSITLIIGPSRRGKTSSITRWRDENNHGRSVLITAPVYGGARAMINEIASAVGVSTRNKTLAALEAIHRAFNSQRILIVDEAHRLIPSDSYRSPVCLELLRDLHDRTGCALALVSTARFDSEVKSGDYQYEQLLGRIGMPIRLPKNVEERHFLPILRQYVKAPSRKLIDAAGVIANARGSLGILVETLKVSSNMAANERKALCEEHVWKAMKVREVMSGGVA